MSWYLDSGCSRHMTGKRSMFQDPVLKSAGEVKFEGDHKGKIIGSGTISIGNSPSITNVLLVDGLAHNLFSKPAFKSKNIVSSSRPLELLHIDMFGPVKTVSVRGKKYGLVIVDDYSRWTWVKFLKHKDESHTIFFDFSALRSNL